MGRPLKGVKNILIIATEHLGWHCGHAGSIWSQLRLYEDENTSLADAQQLSSALKLKKELFTHKSRKAKRLESYVLLHDNTEELRQ